ncbi:MAG: glycosyltransferase family 2 protein [Candidatus Omnitrophota bacterium]
MELPKITFFIPTYNEEKRIARCLESIASQKYPKEKIEILVVDGGSTDKTREVAANFPGVKLLDNPKKLADYGIKIAIREASGELFVIFAADNGLASEDWLDTQAKLFLQNINLSVTWCRMIASGDDAAINHYYALIQNDPLSFFVNDNLSIYLKGAISVKINNYACSLFSVDSQKPLIWGANGLIYRTRLVRDILMRDEFIADNDVFQILMERKDNFVAYIPRLYVYHHHLRRLSNWVKKWERNFIHHLLEQRSSRNMNWIFVPDFKRKMIFWIIYSAIPIFSITQAAYFVIRDKELLWLYHPLVSFLQMFTYARIILSRKDGWRFIRGIIFGK